MGSLQNIYGIREHLIDDHLFEAQIHKKKTKTDQWVLTGFCKKEN